MKQNWNSIPVYRTCIRNIELNYSKKNQTEKLFITYVLECHMGVEFGKVKSDSEKCGCKKLNGKTDQIYIFNDL